MSCRKCVRSSESPFCAQCSALVLPSPFHLLRESKFIQNPQSNLSEILENLRLRQHKISDFPLDYQTSRADLVNLILEESEKLSLASLTTHLSIRIMDYSHSTSLIPKLLFRAISMVCILISTKAQEAENIPNFEELSSDGFNLKSLELEILSLLNWKLHISTSLHFVEFYSTVGFILDNEVADVRSVKIARKFAEFLCDLCITETRFAKVYPEELALCCLAAGRHKVGITGQLPEVLVQALHKQADSGLLSEMMKFYYSSFPE